MKKRNLFLLTALMMMPMVACNANGTSTTTAESAPAAVAQKANDFAFLTQMGIDIKDLTDVKRVDDLTKAKGITLTAEQRAKLTTPLGEDFVEDMGDTDIIAVRDIDGERTLVFYRIRTGDGAHAIMAIYDDDGTPHDAILFRYCHNLWPVNPETYEDNLFRELSPVFEFNGKKHFNVAYTLKEFVFDPATDAKGAPQWQVRWHNDYDIDNRGYFVLKEQKEDGRSGNKSAIDEYITRNMKYASLDAMSTYDTNVMDRWNKLVPEMEAAYREDLSFVDMHLNALFDTNPTRFLRWMCAHRGNENKMLPYFKKGSYWYGPSVEKALAPLTPDEQQYIRSIIKNWKQ
ncbi:MAG: hypothetical protein IKX39_06420 [Muribaculaceae bacterium]|nr:hypothetical protein [Muribaculaceae bacterium]